MSFDAAKYIEQNAYDFELGEFKDMGQRIRCISDRASRSEDQSKDIAIPGAGLGLVMDVLGGLSLLRQSGRNFIYHPDQAVKAVEDTIGVILYHTDEKSLDNGGLQCGGCSHIKGALQNPAAYLLSETDAKIITESILPALEKKLLDRGIKPAVYSGRHNGSAVMEIPGESIGLPSSDGTYHVHVYSLGAHQLILKEAAKKIFGLFSAANIKISSAEWESLVLKAARERLNITLKKNALRLPVYMVVKKTGFAAEPVK